MIEMVECSAMHKRFIYHIMLIVVICPVNHPLSMDVNHLTALYAEVSAGRSRRKPHTACAEVLFVIRILSAVQVSEKEGAALVHLILFTMKRDLARLKRGKSNSG